ncbi:MAG: class I SAM-dependent methyltransferase [Candidatus Omnitrophota bacterium]|nr:class I SAM-dependent methyltransferase [Candidatus Omnitrophota bacterium]
MGNLNPIYLKKEDIEEVAEFMGLDFASCKERIINYSSMELARRWHRMNPMTHTEIVQFYNDNPLYVFELTKANASKERLEFHGAVIAFLLKNYPASSHPKVLDFGSGVGSDAIKFSEKGHQVSFADIPGKTAKFAEYRFKKRNINACFVPITGEALNLKEKYDIIICFDVLEHISNPIKTLSGLVKHLTDNGVIGIINCPNDENGDHPCHLPHTFLSLGKLWQQTLDYAGLVEAVGSRHVYRKATGLKSFLKKTRYYFWNMTSLYVSRVPKIEKVKT